MVPEKSSIAIPERLPSGPGDVCGVVERYWEPVIHADGTEQRFKFQRGAKRGFQYSRDWHKSKLGCVLIVEGFGDVASAHAAGFIAFGRPTRAANLEPLASMLNRLEAWQPVYVLCENDPDDIERGIFPRKEVEGCAAKLGEAIKRRVAVVSPPSEFKDFNDWWKAELQAKRDEIQALSGIAPELHRLDSETLQAIGRSMLGYLRDQADAEIVGKNRLLADAFRDSEITKAEFERAYRRMDDDGTPTPDMDYEVSNSCTYQQVLLRQSEDKPETSIMGALLACGRWSCPACRRRILIPKWTIAITKAFANERGVFSQRIPLSDVDSCKRKMQRMDARAIAR